MSPLVRKTPTPTPSPLKFVQSSTEPATGRPSLPGTQRESGAGPETGVSDGHPCHSYLSQGPIS